MKTNFSLVLVDSMRVTSHLPRTTKLSLIIPNNPYWKKKGATVFRIQGISAIAIRPQRIDMILYFAFVLISSVSAIPPSDIPRPRATMTSTPIIMLIKKMNLYI